MKKRLLILVFAMQFANTFSQVTPGYSAPPINNNPALLNGTTSNQFWSRAGNTALLGTNNIFGTLYNAPVYHQTFGLTRMTVGHLPFGANLDGNGGLNPLTGNRLTRIAISRDGQTPILRPLSLLHIGYDFFPGAPNVAQGGTRRWMDVGLLNMSGTDHLYVGMAQQGNAATGKSYNILATPTDKQDAVICFGDNDNLNNGIGPDNMCFIYTAPPSFATLDANTNDGLEIMRMIYNGNVGLGPRFWSSNQPKSNLHMNSKDSTSNWLQISNQWQGGALTQYTGTISPNNGLKIGILGTSPAIKNGNAYIYNQENRHLIFSTGYATPTDVLVNAFERMRITAISAPTNLPAGSSPAYGVYNPGNISNIELTRIAITHNPGQPLTRPLSLLHLGYNASGTGTPADLSGWRRWMDVGTFTNQPFGTFGGASMYSGIKINPFPNPSADAVLAWGYDTTTSDPNTLLPTRMRFLFTTNAGGSTISGGANGIEAAHFWTDGNNTRMGIGDMQTAAVDPKNTLEIRSSAASPYFASANASGLRFTNLTSADSIVPNGVNGVNSQKVLTVDSLGDVVLTNAAGAFGNVCGATIANPLTSNWEIPLNNFNYVFSGQDTALTGNNNVGIGTSCTPTAKLEVLQNISTTVGNTRAAKISNLGTTLNTFKIGLDLESSGGYSNVGQLIRVNNSTSTSLQAAGTSGGIGIGMTGNLNRCLGLGVTIQALNVATAGNFQVTTVDKDITGINVFTASSTPILGANINRGLNISTQGVASNNYAIIANSGNGAAPTYPNVSNMGVYASSGQNGFCYSFYADALPPIGTTTTTNNKYAGFFNGGVYIAQTITASDELMKKDMIAIPDALTKIKQLEAISFSFDQDLANDKGLSLPANLQYGFKAQQVASLFPDLVSGVHKPEMLDSLGNVVKPAYDFQGLNYQGFIALLTRGMQQQQKIIDSLQTDGHNKDSIQDAQIQQLMNMVNACCQNQGGRTQTPNAIDIELSDKDAVVLNQNVPNPYAEQTTITFYIPEKSGFAQIIFNDMKGQIIKVVDIKTKGKGQLNVFANDLSAGMYSYSLFVDGKLADTKKMVKTE